MGGTPSRTTAAAAATLGAGAAYALYSWYTYDYRWWWKRREGSDKEVAQQEASATDSPKTHAATCPHMKAHFAAPCLSVILCVHVGRHPKNWEARFIHGSVKPGWERVREEFVHNFRARGEARADRC